MQVNASTVPTGDVKGRFKILLSAYSCEPNRGSEPGVGWNMVQQISRFHEVWVFTKVVHRGPIEAEIAKNPMPNVHWVFVDVPKASKPIAKRSTRIHYYLWQIAAYQEAKRQHAHIKFDLAHHVTYVSYWTPSFISFLPIPFVWGPVGGGESIPDGFYKILKGKGKWSEILRNVVRKLAHLDPFLHMTARHSDVGFATTDETFQYMKQLGAKKVQIMQAIALTTEECDLLENLPKNTEDTFRVFSIARLLNWKGIDLGLIAFAQLLKAHPNSEYWILGDGEERDSLEALVNELGLKEKVHFWGNLPRADVLNKLSQSNVLLHPSLHDSGGYVCLEAMSSGRPVVCLDTGGPGVLVTDTAGFKIPAITPEQATDEMAKAMIQLAQNPEISKQMGDAGRQHVRDHYTWDKKGEATAKIYAEVTGTEIPETAIIT